MVPSRQKEYVEKDLAGGVQRAGTECHQVSVKYPECQEKIK